VARSDTVRYSVPSSRKTWRGQGEGGVWEGGGGGLFLFIVTCPCNSEIYSESGIG
jgi:hypothetical protein